MKTANIVLFACLLGFAALLSHFMLLDASVTRCFTVTHIYQQADVDKEKYNVSLNFYLKVQSEQGDILVKTVPASVHEDAKIGQRLCWNGQRHKQTDRYQLTRAALLVGSVFFLFLYIICKGASK